MKIKEQDESQVLSSGRQRPGRGARASSGVPGSPRQVVLLECPRALNRRLLRGKRPPGRGPRSRPKKTPLSKCKVLTLEVELGSRPVVRSLPFPEAPASSSLGNLGEKPPARFLRRSLRVLVAPSLSPHVVLFFFLAWDCSAHRLVRPLKSGLAPVYPNPSLQLCVAQNRTLANICGMNEMPSKEPHTQVGILTWQLWGSLSGSVCWLRS